MMVATRLAEASATLRAQSEPLRLSRTGHWDERVAPLCALLCLVKVPPLSCSRHLAEQGEERRRDKMRREEKLKDFPAPRCPRSRHNSPPPATLFHLPERRRSSKCKRSFRGFFGLKLGLLYSVYTVYGQNMTPMKLLRLPAKEGGHQ